MTFNDYLVFGIVSSIILGAGLVAYTRHFAPDARERRKRRRNYSRVVPKARRPMVQLSARVEKASK